MAAPVDPHPEGQPALGPSPIYTCKQKGRPATRIALFVCMVPKAGLEPARDKSHHPLKMACLPIPPLRQKSLVAAG